MTDFNAREAADKRFKERQAAQQPPAPTGFNAVSAAARRFNKDDEVADPNISPTAQKAQERFGGGFDTDNFASTALRFDLSRGDNLAEKNARIKKIHPDGEVRFFSPSVVEENASDFPSIEMFRESPDDPWKAVNPPGLDFGDIAAAVGPSVESIAGEGIAAGLLSRGVGPAVSMAKTVAGQLIGALAGESVEQVGQSLTGKQRQTPGEQIGEVATEGVFSVAGNVLLGSAFNTAKNISDGAGVLRVAQEGLEVMESARRIDPKIVERATPAIVGTSPVARLLEKQSASLLSALPERYTELLRLIDSGVRRRAKPGDILKIVTQQTDDLAQRYLDVLKLNRRTSHEGGRAIQKGTQEFIEGMNGVIALTEGSARSLGEPILNTKSLKNLADDIGLGKLGTVDPTVGRIADDIASLDGPIRLSDGSQLQISDQLKNIQEDLFQASFVPPGSRELPKHKQAKALMESLGEVFDNASAPRNLKGQFRSEADRELGRQWNIAWKTARLAEKAKFDALSKAPIIEAAKTVNPGDLVQTYVRPQNSGNLRILRESMSRQRWDEFRESAYSKFLDDPAKTLDELNKFDAETLRIIMPEADRNLWFDVGGELKRIYGAGIEELADRTQTNKNFIDGLVRNKDPRDNSVVLRAMLADKDIASRQSVRGAIIEWAWDDIITPNRTGLTINEPGLKANVKALQDSGVWNLLGPGEKQLLSDATVVSRAFASMTDAGTALLAAQTVSEAKKLQSSAVGAFLRAHIMGQVYTSNIGRRFLIGSGQPKSTSQTLRLFGGALAQVSRPVNVPALVAEQEREDRKPRGLQRQ